MRNNDLSKNFLLPKCERCGGGLKKVLEGNKKVEVVKKFEGMVLEVVKKVVVEVNKNQEGGGNGGGGC